MSECVWIQHVILEDVEENGACVECQDTTLPRQLRDIEAIVCQVLFDSLPVFLRADEKDSVSLHDARRREQTDGVGEVRLFRIREHDVSGRVGIAQKGCGFVCHWLELNTLFSPERR